MDKILSQDQVKTILDNAPKGTDPSKIVNGLVSRGYILQGLNDQPVQSPIEQKSVMGSAGAAVHDVVKGVAKGAFETVQNAGKLVTEPLNKVMPLQANGLSKEELAPVNTAESIGKGVEQVAEFAVPGAAGAKVAKAPGLVNLAARVGTEAIGAGATTLAQTGNLQDAKQAAVVGGAFPVLGKVAGAVKSEKNAGRMINSLIKTKLNDLSFGKNPGKTVAEEGITGNNLDELVKNIGIRKDQIGEEIGAIMKKATEEGKKVNVFEAFKPLDDAIAQANKAKLSNAPLITKLENLKTDLTKGKTLDNLTPEEAFNIKQGVAELTKFTGNPSDDKAANSALMKVYGNIRDQINKSVGDKNLAVLNDKYGNLLTAVKAGTKRTESLQGQNLVSLGGKSMGTLTALATALGTGGAAIPTILAGLAVAGGEKALSSPAMKTRLAKWLASKSSVEKKEIFKTAPYLKGLIITNTIE